MLSKHNVMQHIINRKIRQDTVMEDFCDGDNFKSDAFFLENPNALRIHLYCDEFEVCNPIGSKRGKHKMIAFYYTIGNFHPKYRSQLRFSFLAILCRYVFIKFNSNNYNLILTPLLNDLKILQQQGLQININGINRIIKGKLVSISGDNLSMHMLGGFQTYFNSGRICRSCMVDYTDIAENFIEDEFQLRDRNVHQYHLQAISQNALNSSIYGVIKKCSFEEELDNFDITQSLPHDIMHDVLEGVIPVTVRLVLKHYTKVPTCKLDFINHALETIKLAYPSNRPNTITKIALNSHLSGSAIQKLELFYQLPRLLNPYVNLNENDKVWQVYLLLREICDYLLAPVLDRESLFLLKDLTVRYLQSFVEVFGKDDIIPKHHFMIHYARQMRLYGPLKHMWCMRFEAKHQYFKKLLSTVRNFKNVAITCSKRHQLKQAWELSGELTVENKDIPRNSKIYSFNYLPPCLRITVSHVLETAFIETEKFASVSSYMYEGNTFKVNGVYVLDVVGEEETPLFIMIKYIICLRDNWMLCCRLYVPSAFVQRFHAFLVNEDVNAESWLIVRPDQVLDSTLQDCYKIGDQYFVSLRYAVTKQ